MKDVYVYPGRIDFYFTLKPKISFCPHCGSFHIVRKEWKQSATKHTIYLNKESIVHVKYCRYKCKDCGKTFSEKNPIKIKNQSISLGVVDNVLKELSDINSTYDKTGKRFHISASSVLNILDKYYAISKKKLPFVMCIDEIYIQPEQTQPYACVLLNHKNDELVEVLQGRSKSKLNNYFLGKNPAELQNVGYITMDMWDPYLDVAKRCFPDAIVAVDSFHVMEHFLKAMHDIRCRVARTYDDNSDEHYILFTVKKSLVTSHKLSTEKVYYKKLKNYYSEKDLTEMARKISKDIDDAYNFYHVYRVFNETATYENAESTFDEIINAYSSLCRIKELKDVIIMLQNWKQYIINSFIVVDGRRLSNGPMESTNGRLKKLKNTMGKVANFDRYRKRCFLCINKVYAIKYDQQNKIKKKGKKRGKYKKKKSQS